MNDHSLGGKTPPIYVVSGGKGLAGDSIVQSVLIQFPNNTVPVIIVPDVLNQAKMDDVISKVLQTKGVIVHTMVDPDARKMLINSCVQRGVLHIDLAGDLSDYLSNLLRIQPICQPGFPLFFHSRNQFDALYVNSDFNQSFCNVGFHCFLKTSAKIFCKKFLG